MNEPIFGAPVAWAISNEGGIMAVVTDERQACELAREHGDGTVTPLVKLTPYHVADREAGLDRA